MFVLLEITKSGIFFTAASNESLSNLLTTIPDPVLSIMCPVSSISLKTTGMHIPISSECFVGEEAVLENVFLIKKILKLLNAIKVGNRFLSEYVMRILLRGIPI